MAGSDRLRAAVGADRHPARAVPCPWCKAAARQPCVTARRGRRLTAEVHPARAAAWTTKQAGGAR